MTTTPRFALAGSLLAALFFLLHGNAGAGTLAAWSQYGEQGAIGARVVTDAPACPALIADGKSLPMTERAAPSGEFPVRVCVAAIPKGARRLTAGGMPLPVPVVHPRHIVVFGDTGCRVKGDTVQNCNDQNGWPFREVAEHAAKEKPDLMIHLGDYVYRESRCRQGDGRCAGSPWGDNWSTWSADFFAPAGPLLRSTVWLMARGNHEDCRRNGTGWTTLIGHDPITRPCDPHESPLLIDLGGVKLAVLDDNNAADLPKDLDSDVAGLLKQDIAAAMAAKADWLVTHHPFRGISKVDAAADGKSWEGSNATLLSALAGTDEARLTLMLAGHIHNFQIMNYAGAAAPQLVVGEGGAQLDAGVPPQLAGLSTGGKVVEEGMSVSGFGYVVIDRIGQSADWNIVVRSADGGVLRRCKLERRKLSCAAVGAGPSR
ncbi:MAG: metallophosphoesterase [Steroidobacteraceae bacterium]|jgi:predicted phosphodiesterase